MNFLKIGKGNAKLTKDTATFSLLAGHSCPGASKCEAFVTVDENGKAKINTGKDAEFRCFSANAEARFPNTYKAHKYNFDLVKHIPEPEKIAELIHASIVAKNMIGKIKFFRVHVDGDFFMYRYFKAWMLVAAKMPEVRFYSYTKSLNHLLRGMKEGIIPDNYVFTASRGGKFDHLIDEHGLRSARVVMNEAEAESLGLPIDHDDSNAREKGGDFALLIHGGQPKGTEAAVVWDKMMKKGVGGYRKGKERNLALAA